MRYKLRNVAFGLLVLGLVLFSAEFTSRLDDWIHQGVPLLANPDRTHDLTIHDEHGIRGRPNGSYKKWKLNAYGFRGPEITLRPPKGITRVLLLGSSETFGLYESPQREYPTQLAEILQRRGEPKVEIVNVALAGMTVRSMIPYWEKWLYRFRPNVVVIYASPLFYLDDEPPGPVLPPRVADAPPETHSRFFDRIWDTVRQSDLIRRIRIEFLIASRSSGKGDGWFFQEVPAERVDQFMADLKNLIAQIKASGAVPVLVTPALRASSPDGAEDQQDLHDFRMFYPRATRETFVAFEDAAVLAIKAYAKTHKIQLIDAARKMNGHRPWFADLVHFSDEGASVLAQYMADELTPLLKDSPPSNP